RGVPSRLSLISPRRASSSPFNLVSLLDAPATTELYPLSLHDALPICHCRSTCGPTRCTRCSTSGSCRRAGTPPRCGTRSPSRCRSEEHTSELQSRFDLVCRLLLEKKKKTRAAQMDSQSARTKPESSRV